MRKRKGELGRTQGPHPPQSPGLAVCSSWLCPKIKMTMTGKCFELIWDIRTVTTAQLETLTEQDCRAAAESDRQEMSVFEVMGGFQAVCLYNFFVL